MDKSEIIVVIMATVGMLVLVGVILTLPMFFLWNWLMPILFNLPEITIWQALGLTLLSSVLFKSSCNCKK